LQTDDAIRELQLNSGSTAVVSYIHGDTLYVANAGDARAVLGRFGTAKRLSHDHKADDPEEVERIEKLGGKVFTPYFSAIPRVNGNLAIARSLGDHFFDNNFVGVDLVTANPYISRTKLQPEDDVLILACDGVWDVLSDQEAIDIVRGELKPAKKRFGDSVRIWDLDAQAAALKLKDQAYQKGSRDNITAVVLKLNIPQ
jgi:serine/threonine protein phosphatase PrpC